ncbi:MAG: hypothetical protein ABIN25_03585, partial [Ginsengibacter sp.]
IAQISELEIKQQLIAELKAKNAFENLNQTQRAKGRIYKLIPRQIQLPSLFKLSWLTKVS